MLISHLYIFHEVSFMSFPILKLDCLFIVGYSVKSGYKSFDRYMCYDFFFFWGGRLWLIHFLIGSF